MANGKSLLLGFLVGGAVGATATLFSTPKSGKQLRTDLKVKSEELAGLVDKMKDEGKLLTEQIANTSKEGAALIKELSADVKTSLESWRNTIEPHQKNIQKHLAQIEESLKELEEKTKK
ncbi:YtxH domain-containing protein [Aquibacillus koreensis]|uniref:YtxH domain-containing protein n=1 Tax=Aquibacillus koreensis TaxID=279446 RepID=A0A9X3WHQ4_9BACI|nr:YtxH domain-containing protein [Aquibacillus koreensis]MCT2535568.1 YtxH domain-containing protein [Aquibacillus koreensis]MDC3420147.1 YtxH domain-containing protein [Aquibacillus koreensis]